MKNRIRISVLCICILLTALGCGGKSENEAVSEERTESFVQSVESAAATESTREEQPVEAHDYYEELIADARECIEGKVKESEDYDFSYMIYRYGAYYGASMGLGYLIEDLDKDGTEELIFGENSDPDSAYDSVIYDLYTIDDGKLVHVLEGGERSRYYLCENGMIAHEGSSSAATSVNAYYTFEGTELHLAEAVLYNGWDYEDNPWFYSTQTDSYYNVEDAEPVNAEQAQTIMEKYVYEHLMFIPFVEEQAQEIQEEIDGIMEIYDGGNIISVTEDVMVAQAVPETFLKGAPVLYDRFRVDGWVFEWLISDHYEDNNWFGEDGVLVISREGSSEDAQIISVKAEGGYATWVLAKNKFEYVDVNFDGRSDLLICTGHHGNQGLLTYYCFIQTKDGFEEVPSFTDIPNPSVDAEHKLILSQWRNSASSHSWAEYQYLDNTYVLYRELTEYAEAGNSGEDVWVWTVNGEVIGRSDKLTPEEIDDLIYNENSEWGISQDRWRTLYNSGLTTDFSIYGEPGE